MFDVIIVGGGPAGMNAALYLLRNNKKVLILEKESFGGQIATSPRLENFPTIKSISGTEFTDLFFEQITELGAEFDIEEVTSISKEGKTFKVKTNFKEYECKAVIIANGVQNRTLGLPNEEKLVGKGVSYCAVCDGPFYKGKEAYLIGDANTALQYSLLLADYCTKVHIFTLFDKFFGEKVLIENVLSNEKIEIRHNMLIKELIEENNELTALKFENKETGKEEIFPTDNVFVAIGKVSNNDCFKDLISLDEGYIITDETMGTSVPGIFAAGDTRKKYSKQVITACNDGAVAAMSALNYINNL